jgi:serine/threonine protein phosphatase PrpC
MTFRTACQVEFAQALGQDRAACFAAHEQVVLILADGAGGTSGGAAAAEAVIEAVHRACTQGTPPNSVEAWCQLFCSLDADLPGLTTAVGVTVSSELVFGACVGDSIAWQCTPEGFDDLSSGTAAKPLLGDGGVPHPFSARRVGTLLLASDGLWKYAPRSRLHELSLLADLDMAARQLINAVRLPTGTLPDDVSVVLCRDESG